MKTLILSDLHLGSKNSQTDSIARVLRTDFDRLILNGDTINNLNLKKLKPRHWKIFGHIREIARDRDVILIRGNHDATPGAGLHFGPRHVLATLLSVPLREEFRLETDGGDYLVLHGDRFDSTITWPILTDTADWCYHTVQKVNKKAAKWLKRRVKKLGGVIEFVKRRALYYARAQGCRGVIASHTHFADNEWVDGIHYLNTGCWTDHVCNYVTAQGADVRLCQWDDFSERRGVLRSTPDTDEVFDGTTIAATA
jgi:UDP-2,3-diacylglucosamine pyrophosphatase LpxH